MTKIIKTVYGRIQGMESGTPGISVYKGIPYAAPPVGELRFSAPRDPVPWEGVLCADKFGPTSIMPDGYGGGFYDKEFFSDGMPASSEDCLSINIWAPDDAKDLPVLLWIHGGAFMGGYGYEKEFDGEAFAKRGVILATINYRLGLFGFFAHKWIMDVEGHSGNMGVLDAIQAIKWLRENIASFGGNPDKITIAGQSAGGMTVQTIISSPLSKGMIAGAIIQSGGGLRSPISFTMSLEQQFASCAEFVNFIGVPSLEGLRALSARALMNHMASYRAYKKDAYDLRFMPVLDGWLIPKNVDDAAMDGDIHDIPYMIGSCADEFGDGAGPLAESVQRFADKRRELGGKPVYTYRFTRKLPGDDAGAFHSSELWYVFGTLARCWRPFIKEDYDLSARMTDCWANFVKYGDPKNGWKANENIADRMPFDI